MEKYSRRDILGVGTAAAVGLALSSIKTGTVYAEGGKNVRIGFIGTGGRGKMLLGTLLKTVEDVEVPAVCDIIEQRVKAAQDMVVSKGRKKPEGYFKDEHDYKNLLAREDIDAVIIATPWDWHTKMAVDAMNAGKYTGVEVPCAWTLDECWDLVNTHEKTKVPCMMLENWSFRPDNLAVLNMIRKGLFGEIIHCHCAHSHNCVDVVPWFFQIAPWSVKFLEKHNRDLYPSHQLGPVISWMDIGCGDYFDYITSTATKSVGINDSFIRHYGKDHPNATLKLAQGDIVTTVIKTKNGKTIVDNVDMCLPRPYDNRWLIQGTRGLYDEMGGDTAGEERKSIYMLHKEEGKSLYPIPKEEKWEPFAPYGKEYEHKWARVAKFENKQLHGQTDEIELKLFVEAVRNKTQTPIDVYDSVIMCVTGPLSEKSIASGSKPIEVPDFTRGKWKTKNPAFGI